MNIQNLGLDAGYVVGVVHRGLEIIGLTGYTSLRFTHNNIKKEIFTYQPEKDIFKCTEDKVLKFSKLIFKKELVITVYTE